MWLTSFKGCGPKITQLKKAEETTSTFVSRLSYLPAVNQVPHRRSLSLTSSGWHWKHKQGAQQEACCAGPQPLKPKCYVGYPGTHVTKNQSRHYLNIVTLSTCFFLKLIDGRKCPSEVGTETSEGKKMQFGRFYEETMFFLMFKKYSKILKYYNVQSRHTFVTE